MPPLSTKWRCLTHWGKSVCANMHVGGRVQNGFIQLPCVWFRKFTFSPPHDQAPSFVSGLCPLPASTPPLFKLSTCQASSPSRVLCQMGLCFKTQHFRDSGLGPAATLWRRLLLSNGLVLACPRKHLCDCIAAEVQRLWEITTHSQCQVLLYSEAFFPVPTNVAGSPGIFAAGKLYGLYQKHYKQEEPLLPVATWTPLT